MRFLIVFPICVGLIFYHFRQCDSSIQKRSLFGLNKPEGLPSLTPVTLQDIKGLTDQIKGLNTLTARLEKALAAEKEVTKSLQGFFETAKEKFAELENTVNPDKGNYWAESKNCGGILVAQTGRIKFDVLSSSSDEIMKKEKCVWTIRANFRSQVRVKFLEESDEVFQSMYATEIKESDTNTPSIIRLNSTSTILEGPLIILTYIPSGDDYSHTISIEFEGLGKNVNKDVSYHHYHFDDMTSSLSQKNVSSSDPKKSKSIKTFVINPVYKDIAELHVKSENKLDCTSKSNVVFYENLIQPVSPVSCCKPEGHCEKSFENADGIFLITEIGDAKAKTNLDFSWNLDTEVSKIDSVNTCGGVLKGRRGTIEYKASETYSKNERCVWIIQPTEKDGVQFNLISSGLEPEYDVLTLTPLSLTVSDKDPETLTLTSENKLLSTEGNVILVTFYSDSLTEGTGFNLRWEETGAYLSDEEKQIEVVYKSDDEGSYKTDGKKTRPELIVLNPHYCTGIGLNLKLNMVQADIKPDTAQGIQILGNDVGDYTVAQKFLETPEGGFPPESFENSFGVFALLSVVKEGHEIDISWMKGSGESQQPEADETTAQVVEQSEGCGGILKGDRGKINYKLNMTYENRERCTWVIESKGRSKLSLKLLEDEFESCCDFLVAVPLDPSTGSLLTDKSSTIKRENKIASFSSSVVFVTFYSDVSATGTGFSLEFTSGGKLVESQVKYRHQFISATSGSISYPNENEITDEVATSNEILTFIWSPDPVTNETLQSVFDVSLSGFGSDKKCREDSLKIYETPVNKLDVPNILSCEKDDNSCECVTEYAQNSTLSLTNRGFIGIFRPVASSYENKNLKIHWTINNDDPSTDGNSTSSAI